MNYKKTCTPELEFMSILNRAKDIFKTSFIKLSPVLLIGLVPQFIGTILARGEMNSIIDSAVRNIPIKSSVLIPLSLFTIVSALLNQLFYSVIISYTADKIRGRKSSLKSSFATAAAAFPKALAAFTILGLATLIVSIFIVPVIYIALTFPLYLHAIVIYKTGIFESFVASQRIIKGHRLHFIGLMLLTLLMQFAVISVAGLVASPFIFFPILGEAISLICSETFMVFQYILLTCFVMRLASIKKHKLAEVGIQVDDNEQDDNEQDHNEQDDDEQE